MPGGDGTGPQGMGRGTGRGRKGDFNLNSPYQKSTLAGTLFAFASMLVGKWLDKKFSEKKSKTQSVKDEKHSKTG